MLSFIDHLANLFEQLEIFIFRRKQCKPLEMRNNFIYEIIMIPNFKFYCFIVIITANISATKIFFDDIQNLTSIFVLAHRETWSQLPTKQSFCFFVESYSKTSLTIDISGNIFRNIATFFS